MSWGGWSARLNVTSIVSQGLEQVSKLREDVEKQFDQAVLSAKPPLASAATSSSSLALAAASGGASALTLEREQLSSSGAAPIAPPAAAAQHSVDDILVRRATPRSATPPQPPHSADGKPRRAPQLLPAPLSFVRAAKREGTEGEAGEKSAGGSSQEVDGGAQEGVGATGVEEATVGDGGGSGGGSQKELAVDAVESGEEKPQAPDDAEGGERATDDDEGRGEASTAGSGSDGADIHEADAPDELSDSAMKASEIPAAEGDGDAGANNVELEADGADGGAGSPEADEAVGTDDDDGGDEESHNPLAGDAAALHLPSSNTQAALAGEIASLRQHLKAREDQLLATSSTIQELHDELDKTCQREVTAVERVRFLTEQLELMRIEVTKLNRMASGQRDSDLAAMQVALSEKDEKLKALLEEGQALSVKQAQFEQRVRQLRKEKNEEEEQRQKLQTQVDSVTTQLQEQTTKLKAAEEDKKKFQQELRQLQSSADANAKKLAKAEQDASSFEEQAQQLRAQVEQLSQRNESLEKEVVEAKEMSHSNAALSGEKAELEQAIHFLHQSLQDLESESTRREESARAEIQDLKRKWQEAVSRVDLMGQSVSEATQPLLRQINALQDDQRARQETWKATEATLLQRINDANEARRAVEHDKLERDEHIHTLQSRIDALEQEAKRRASELAREKEKAASAVSSERELHDQLDAALSEREEWKIKAQTESTAREQVQLRLNNERKLSKRAESEAESTAVRDAELAELRAREVQLSHDLEWHQNEVRRLKTAALQQRGSSVNGIGSSRGSNNSSSGVHLNSFDSNESKLAAASAETQAAILKQSLEIAGDDAYPGGASVLGMSQLQQRLRLREGENRLVKQQLQAFETKQSQLTEEIVRLSTRNALLETNETRFQQTQEELQELKQRQHVLLELFGEKEEQVEELQSEVGELKAFYRKQLDTLAKHHEQL